jgi:hypothetical protein
MRHLNIFYVEIEKDEMDTVDDAELFFGTLLELC